MKGCVFCQIVKGEKTAGIVYEDDKAMAILSNAPTTKGHTVILSKNHFINLFDLPLELAKHLIAVIKEIAPAVTKAMKTDSYVLGMNNGPATKNHVDHAHMHIIPRHFNDKLQKWPDGSYKEGEMEEIKNKIKNKL